MLRGFVLVRVSTNLAIGVLRKKGRLLIGLPEELRPAVVGDLEDDVVAGIDLRSALLRLPLRQREAVVMRYMAGVTEPDIALAMGCSVGTVKTHTRRGLQALRSHLRPRTEP